jgi:hypothetical protein
VFKLQHGTQCMQQNNISEIPNILTNTRLEKNVDLPLKKPCKLYHCHKKERCNQ